jgi:hypothetical protein
MTATTFEQVHAEFLMVVGTKPEGYAYQRPALATSPLYVHVEPTGDLACGCIVGHWLHLHRGVPLEALVPLEGISGPSVVLQLMATDVLPMNLLNHPTSAQLLKFLQMLQSFQDVDTPWAEAVEIAHNMVTTPPWSLLLAPSWEPAVPARVHA